MSKRTLSTSTQIGDESNQSAYLPWVTPLKMPMACATMDAGLLASAGSSRVVLCLATPLKASRYCSAIRRLAASLPPLALQIKHRNVRPGAEQRKK